MSKIVRGRRQYVLNGNYAPGHHRGGRRFFVNQTASFSTDPLIVSGSPQPYDSMEFYGNGARLNGLNQGWSWGGPYVGRNGTSIVRENISTNDNATVITGSQLARPVILPSQWSKIRIGVRHQFVSASGNLTNTPRYAFGLCNGTGKLVGDPTASYFVGVISTGASYTWSGPGTGSVFSSVTINPATKAGTSLNTGTALSSDWRVGANTTASAYRTGWYVDITKGSPNYSFISYYFQGSAGADLSVSNFLASMTGSPQVSDGSSGVTSGAQTIAVNETLSGSLNAVAVWWDHGDSLLEISDVALAVLL